MVHYASRTNSIAALKFLLDRDADINIAAQVRHFLTYAHSLSHFIAILEWLQCSSLLYSRGRFAY